MALTRKTTFTVVALLLAVLLIACTVTLFRVTGDLDLEWEQEPNVVELFEANRKLKLFNEAQAKNRKGFIRLSEVEINSYLQERYKPQTNSPANPVRLERTALLLTSSNLTLVTWVRRPVLRVAMPMTWQRTFVPRREKEQWNFQLSSMKLGEVNIPEYLWPRINSLLGSSDAAFEERKVWVSKVPAIRLTNNEVTRFPELRLYTYEPQESRFP